MQKTEIATIGKLNMAQDDMFSSCHFKAGRMIVKVLREKVRLRKE